MDIAKFNQFVRDIYDTDKFIPLHEPRFLGNEKKYVLDTIFSFSFFNLPKTLIILHHMYLYIK